MEVDIERKDGRWSVGAKVGFSLTPILLVGCGLWGFGVFGSGKPADAGQPVTQTIVNNHINGPVVTTTGNGNQVVVGSGNTSTQQTKVESLEPLRGPEGTQDRKPNASPRIDAPRTVTFEPGQRSREIVLAVSDDGPVTGLTVTARTMSPDLIPEKGLNVSGSRESRSLTVTPIPGKGGEGRIEVTVTDADKVSVNVVIQVIVPEPALRIGKIDDVTVKYGEPVPPVRVSVVDESAAPGPVTLTVAVNDPLLPADAVAVGADGRTVALTPVKGRFGTATVAVVARSADGRQTRAEFKLTVLAPPEPPPPQLRVAGKARIAPAGGADVIASYAQANGGDNLGVPGLDRGTVVTVAEIRGNRCRVEWAAGGKSYSGWVERQDLAATE